MGIGLWAWGLGLGASGSDLGPENSLSKKWSIKTFGLESSRNLVGRTSDQATPWTALPTINE